MGYPPPANIAEFIAKKSSTTVDYFENHNIQHQLNKWKTYFSQEQLLKMQVVLDYFEIKDYSIKSEFPVKMDYHVNF